MSDDARVREAQSRTMEIFGKRPGAAFSTKKASGRLEHGLTVRAGSGDQLVTIDMPRELGGDLAGPPPGYFIRVGLIGCVAVGIKLAAVRENITIESIDIDLEMDFDDSALLGMGSNSAAPLDTRLDIRIVSDAPREQLEAMVQRALAADPYYLAFKDAQKISARLAPAGG